MIDNDVEAPHGTRCCPFNNEQEPIDAPDYAKGRALYDLGRDPDGFGNLAARERRKRDALLLPRGIR